MKAKKIASIIISVFILSCASLHKNSTNDGSSVEKAIKVKSVEEYQIVRQKCPDCKFKSQSLSSDDKGNFYDVLIFVKPNQEEVKFYFKLPKSYVFF